MPGPGADFVGHLGRQQALLDDFLAVLKREQALLAQTPVAVDTLADVTEAKRRIAAELETLETARRALVANHGYGSDAASTARLAETLGCAPAWRAFIERVAAARRINQTNGGVIQQRLDFATRALTVIHWSAEQTVYGANGRRHLAAGRRIDSGA